MAAAAFSIRRYAESRRGTAAAELGPFDFAAKDLPPMEVRIFRWWEDELAAIKAAEVEADEDEEEAPGRGRTPKKRSISDLFAAAPAVCGLNGGSAAEDEEEALYSIMRRAKELKRKRRQEEGATAAAAEAETSAGGETSEGNFPGKKILDKANLGDEVDIPAEKEKRKQGKLNSLQKKAEKLKYIESRKAIKAGKQRGIKKRPLHSILKKYTKHTSVKMVKEKHSNLKGAGVIELCCKSVKRVKFSEANDSISTKKQCSKRPQLESLCKLFSDAMTSSSSSSIDISSEEEHIAAESSGSRMPETDFTMAKEADENHCKLSNTALPTGLFDLNQALPEPTDLNDPYIANSEGSYLEHTEAGTCSVDQLDHSNGRVNQKDLCFVPHGQIQQQHATDMETRAKGKSPYALASNQTVQDSVQLQNWCSMTLHHDVCQVSTGGKPSSFQFRGCNVSHSEKQDFHSGMHLQLGSRPSAGQTLRLMGHDVTISNTRVGYSGEAAQKHTGPTEDPLTTRVVLELPRQGQPFLSLQTQSIPNVSSHSANTAANISAGSAPTAQAHYGYRNPHDVRHTLPPSNLFSGDPSRYEDRFRDFTNSQPHQNVLLGYPPHPSNSTAAFLQNLPAPWRYYSDHPNRTDSPSVPFSPTLMQRVTPSSDRHTNLSQPYGAHSASSSVNLNNSAGFTLSHPNKIFQGVPDSRASAARPSRNEGTGMSRLVPDSTNASSSSGFVLRSGPVKLSAGAKHILIPSENTDDDDSAPIYSCLSFGSGIANVSAPQNKGPDVPKF